jgi:crotonobetainyl-CoA:carnitine CoA-transferase CaiB-like acyl-CoA transferase
LFARERTGEGQHVRLSMLDTVVFFLWSSDMGGHTFVGDEIETETAQSFIDLVYETADGFVSIAVMQDKEWRALAAAVERPDFLEDERFATAELRDVNKDARTLLTQEAVRPFATEELLRRLEEHDVPCAPVLTRREMIRHPQVVANGVVVETDHPRAGRLRQARQPATFSATPAAIRSGAPGHGTDTRNVLSEYGFSGEEIASLEASGAAIDRSGDPASD